MKKRNKLKIWEVLTEIKKHLCGSKDVDAPKWNGKKRFICHALFHAMGLEWWNRHKYKNNFPAYSLITERMGGSSTLENCLDTHGIEVYRLRDSRKKMQTYRHRWLDSLIKEFKEKDL